VVSASLQRGARNESNARAATCEGYMGNPTRSIVFTDLAIDTGQVIQVRGLTPPARWVGVTTPLSHWRQGDGRGCRRPPLGHAQLRGQQLSRSMMTNI
jgi:hypothetical protein